MGRTNGPVLGYTTAAVTFLGLGFGVRTGGYLVDVPREVALLSVALVGTFALVAAVRGRNAASPTGADSPGHPDGRSRVAYGRAMPASRSSGDRDAGRPAVDGRARYHHDPAPAHGSGPGRAATDPSTTRS